MRAAGARVTKGTRRRGVLHRGLGLPLRDPEGNCFEIAWAGMPNNPVVIATRRAAGA